MLGMWEQLYGTVKVHRVHLRVLMVYCVNFHHEKVYGMHLIHHALRKLITSTVDPRLSRL